MTHWIFLALMGLMAYWMIRRSLARFSTVPWWAIWVVTMLPPTTLVIAQQVFGQELPFLLILLLFVSAYTICIILLSQGRFPKPPPTADQESDPDRSPALKVDPPAPSTWAEAIGTAMGHIPIAEVPKEKLSGCFPWTVFYLQNIEYRPQAIICRGNLRVEPEAAYSQVRSNIEALFGKRFLVVLQEGLAGKPFFALVPNPAARRTSETSDQQDRPWLAVGLALATFFTTLTAAVPAAPGNLSHLLTGSGLMERLPYALGMMTILGAHELSRYWVARHHKIPTSLPYFIPLPFALGTFGAFLNLKAPVPNRKVLFDLGVAGPIAGAITALILLVVGLSLSSTAPFPEPNQEGQILISLQKFDPSLSLFLAILAKVVMGSALGPDQVIQFHPLAFAGWIGLLVLTLNLMPVGQLDGGHVVHAVYGQQMGANIGRITRLLVLLLALTVQHWLLIWSLLLFFISSADEPALNDVTDLSESRDIAGLLLLTFLALIVLPLPPFLQAWMGLA